MLLPKVFVEDLLDDPFETEPGDSRRHLFPHQEDDWMRTDVKETENGYELDMNLPEFKKENVQISLEDGYLTVSATTSKESTDKEKNRFIRKERFEGSCQRSFYVGEGIKKEDIKAKFENGVLHLNLPKVSEKAIDEKKYIAIE